MSVYAVSDLHGMHRVYEAINRFLEPEDTVYFLGDAVDRGPRPWWLFKEIIQNPQWIFLCGNHEDMLAKAIAEYHDGMGSEKYYDLAMNGGSNTFEDWMNDGAYAEWAREIYKLPTHDLYINTDGWKIYLSHAGFTPRMSEDGNVIIPNRFDLLWSRSHFNNEWDEENFADTIVVHGHTPIPYMLYSRESEINAWNDVGAFYYCGDHKINLDTACCWTKGIVLLDLDTFDEYIFQ